VGEVPAGRAAQDAAQEARPLPEDPDPRRHRPQEDPRRPRTRSGAARGQRFGADPAGGHLLVPTPRA
jgi:hypothetical protein